MQIDSIPLYLSADTVQATFETKYQTLVVQNNDSIIFAAGLINLPDRAPIGFLASIQSNREVNWVSQMNMSYVGKQGNLDALKVHLIKEDYPFKTMLAYANKKSASVEVEIVSDQASLENYGTIARFNDKGKKSMGEESKAGGQSCPD